MWLHKASEKQLQSVCQKILAAKHPETGDVVIQYAQPQHIYVTDDKGSRIAGSYEIVAMRFIKSEHLTDQATLLKHFMSEDIEIWSMILKQLFDGKATVGVDLPGGVNVSEIANPDEFIL